MGGDLAETVEWVQAGYLGLVLSNCPPVDGVPRPRFFPTRQHAELFVLGTVVKCLQFSQLESQAFKEDRANLSELISTTA